MNTVIVPRQKQIIEAWKLSLIEFLRVKNPNQNDIVTKSINSVVITDMTESLSIDTFAKDVNDQCSYIIETSEVDEWRDVIIETEYNKKKERQRQKQEQRKWCDSLRRYISSVTMKHEDLTGIYNFINGIPQQRSLEDFVSVVKRSEHAMKHTFDIDIWYTLNSDTSSSVDVLRATWSQSLIQYLRNNLKYEELVDMIKFIHTSSELDYTSLADYVDKIKGSKIVDNAEIDDWYTSEMRKNVTKRKF